MAGPCLRAPLVFIRMARESLATFSLLNLSVLTRASLESTTARQSSRSGVTTPIADPFVSLESRNPRDTESYTPELVLDQIFACFIFANYFSSTRLRFSVGPPPFLPVFCISFAARKNLSNHLCDDAARCECANAARFDSRDCSSRRKFLPHRAPIEQRA